MANVNVTGDRALSFVSTLDNSDFQAKSQQDLALIKLRLELTGDTTGIAKYDEAVQKSLDIEKNLRNQLNEILKAAQIQVEEFKTTVLPDGKKTVFSDSAAEVLAYQNALNGLESGVAIVATLNAELDDLAFEQNRLTAAFEAGTITEAEYLAATEAVSVEQRRLVTNIKQVNDSFSKNILVQQEDVVQTKVTVAAVEEEIGVLQALKITLSELKGAKITASSADLPLINKQIQETEAEIKRFSNVGKVNFDKYGDAVKQNVEKSTNYLSKGFGYLRKLAYILPGVGIAGIIGFATEPIINYVSNLDILTKKLDQARANLEAFNDVNKNANKDASGQIASLTLLYNETQNVTLSMEKRIEAAEQLRDLFPVEFANSTALAIVNGKLKTSYDELTQSIIENARSAAALNRITEEENKILDQRSIIDKNNAIKTGEIQKALSDYRKALASESPASKAASAKGLDVYNNAGYFYTPLGALRENLRQINAKANRENTDPAGLIKQGNKTISYLVSFVQNVTKSGTDLDAANKLLGKNLENFDNLLQGANDEKQLQNIKNALEVKLKALAPGDAQINVLRDKLKQVDALLKEYQVKPTDAKTVQNAADSLLAAQTSTLEKIEALKNKYASKQKSRDEQEADAIRAQFDAQVNNINALNKRYDEFVKKYGKGAANAAGLHRIDPNSLSETETNALAGLAGQQSLAATEKQIDQQKAIFKEYEDFKLQAGTEAANKLYANELKGFTNFIGYLKSLQPAESDLNSTDPFIKARANALSDYLKTALPAAQVEEYKQEQKHLQQLLIQNQTYQQQRKTLIEKTNKDIQQLISLGEVDEANQAQRNLQDQLEQLDLANFQKLQSYKNLANNIDNLSTAEAKKQVSNLIQYAAALYGTGKISLDVFNQMLKQAQKFNEIIDDKLPTGLKNIGSAFKTLAGDVSIFDEGLAKALDTVGSIVTGVGSIKGDINKLNTSVANKDTFGTITSSLGIIGTAIGIFGAVYSFFDNSKEKAEQAAYANELQIKAIEAVNKGLERQLELTKQIYGAERITGYLKQLDDIKNAEAAAQDELKSKISLTGNEFNDKLITAYNQGKGNERDNSLIQNILKAGEAFKLEGKSLEDLQKLLDAGKLDAKTAALVQSLLDLQQQAIDTQNALNEDLLGTSFDALTQSITDLFANATTSAEDFAQNFQKIIQTALLQAFQRDYIQKQLQGFYDDFYNLSKNAPNNVLTKEDIAKLKAEYDEIIAKAGEQFKNIQDVTGVIFDNAGSSSGNTLPDQIKRSITEDTATILAGTLNGIQLGVYSTNVSIMQLIGIAQDQLNAALKIVIATERTAENTESLPTMLEQLKIISSNTSQSLDSQLRAAGLN